MVVWTPEEIAKRTTAHITALRENAHRQKREDIVALCDAELEKRKPTRQSRIAKGDNRKTGQYVSEFHFVCPNELGVTRNPDGSIWTGTWVVAEDNAIDAEARGSLVALHASKAAPSYIQGKIKGWRRSPRENRYSEDQLVKTMSGIDFLFMPDKGAMPWKGDATGEKGYLWADIPD
jgi:hypothetical protein